MKTRKNIAAKVLICMMLSFALIVPMAVPAEVFAATKSTTKTADAYTTAKVQTICLIKIAFNQEVISNTRLPAAPEKLRVTGKASKIKLQWTGVPASSIDGYFILRSDVNGDTWRQVATVKDTATKYTDKAANAKNTFYRYSVIAFRKVGGKIMVSTPAGWAGAQTSHSNKKNVYTVKVSNPANVAAVMSGSCAQTYLSFPKNAYSKYIRWSSDNNAVATVNASGLVTGVKPGKTNINIRTHTGRIISFPVVVTKPGTAQAMIQTINAWQGYSRLNGKHKSIVDIYNSMTPWPVGYKMGYSDAWCDATITAAAIKTGNVERIGRECGVPRHINIFKKLGIWEEDGTIVPNPGDIIVYSWRRGRQPNNASASHIGLVVKVEGKQITCIEGNRGIGVVDTRTIPVGWGFIRGYARPHYAK